MKISKGNSKLGKIPNLSIRPGLDCPNSRYCAATCYAVKAWKQYPATRDAWSENSREWRENPDQTAQAVIAALRKKPPRFFRIHVAGDFLSQAHVGAWATVAREIPQTRFLAFTKSHHLDFSRVPGNLQVVYSMWPGMPDTAPQGARRAWVQDGTETRVPDTAIECPGKCESCGMCWDLDRVGLDVVFHEH